MKKSEIWKKLKTQQYVQMPLGKLYGYFTIVKLNNLTKTITIDIGEMHTRELANIKLKDYQKKWWFIDDEVPERKQKK